MPSRAAAGSTPSMEPIGEDDPTPGYSAPEPRHLELQSGQREPRSLADGTVDEFQQTGLTVSGRVLDTTGESIPGIELMLTTVRLFEDAPETAPVPGAPQQVTLTEFDGRYTFGNLSDGEYRIRSLPAGDYAPAQITVRAGTRSADLVLAAERAHRVQGVVENDRGAPLAGVVVTPILPWASGVTTDQNGRYQFHANLESTRDGYSVRFQHIGYHEKFVSVRESDWAGRDAIWVDASLEPVELAAGVAGTVRTSSDTPLTGEVVQLHSPRLGRRYHAATNLLGEFLMRDVATARDYRLSISPSVGYQDYERDNLEITSKGLYLDVVLEPLRLGRLAGQMVNIDGSPVPRFTLLLRSDSASNQSFRVTGDDQGYFFIDGVPAGELTLETSASPLFTVSGIGLPSGDEIELPLVLDWGKNLIDGQVVESSGQPIPMARITLTWVHQNNGVQSRSSRDTVADAEGRFRFEQLGPGVHGVHVNASGFNQARLDHDAGDRGRELVVELKKSY
jgi:protocatechuate 3,4-dioxygenase beta subunit